MNERLFLTTEKERSKDEKERTSNSDSEHMLKTLRELQIPEGHTYVYVPTVRGMINSLIEERFFEKYKGVTWVKRRGPLLIRVSKKGLLNLQKEKGDKCHDKKR